MMFTDLIKKRRISSHPERDSRRKSLLKALSWRAVWTIDTILLSWLLTWTLMIALSIWWLELITKTFLYYIHERVWSNYDIQSYKDLEQN